MKNQKLRYYLRGLGIGILMTAFILGVAGKDTEELTDAQIREKAIALGMVDGETIKLSDLQKEEEIQSEENLPTETETESETTSEPTETETEETGTTKPETAETEESEGEETESTEPEMTESESVEQTEIITFTISSGTSSYTASKNLKEAGLIADARDFDTYLCDNGYAKSLRVGTYEIAVGTSEEEIAKIITGKH